jgi:hypothetical protein
MTRLRDSCVNFRVNSCGRAEHAVGSRQLVASGSARGSVAVEPCGAMVPCWGIDCVGAQPVAFSRALARPFEPVALLA